MRRSHVLAAVVFALSPHVAAAAPGSQPVTTEPLATFRVAHDPSGDFIVKCAGIDGAYEQIRSTSSGEITSTDPRLSGLITNKERILLNRTTLSATLDAATVIVDPATGAEKFSGTVTGVLSGINLRGVLTGRLADGSRLIANFSVVHDPKTDEPHNLTGTIGGPSVAPVDYAVVQSGGCHGESEEMSKQAAVTAAANELLP